MKHISCLLLIAMLASLSACGGEAAVTDTTPVVTEPEVTIDTSLRENTPDGLPELDFEGAAVNIFYREGTYKDVFGGEEETGELVDDAVFIRNRKVEERLNVDFEYIQGPSDVTEFSASVTASVTAGDDAYDIIFHAQYQQAILAVEGLADREAVRRVAETFGGVPHREELVRVKDGVRYYNDSIASSPSRTIAGLQIFADKVILIAGGYDKHISYETLGPEICRHVKRLYLNGATAPQIRKAVEQAAEYEPGKPEIIDCADFTDAVKRAAAGAEPSDVVFMSPASAAFDQFKNFEVRGNYYKKLVMEL